MPQGTPPSYPHEPVLAPTPAKQKHVIPQVYLRNFVGQDGKIRVTDLRRPQLTYRTGTPVVAVQTRYYDYDLDDRAVSAKQWLTDLEGATAPVLRRVVADPAAITSLSAADEQALARFLAAFRFRTPSFRDQCRRSVTSWSPTSRTCCTAT